MILDEQGLFSNAQAITATAASTNVLDMGKREVSFGTPVEVFIQVNQAFNNLTSLNIKIQTATDAAFTTAVDLEDVTVLAAKLVKGYVAGIKFLPKGNLGYLRMYYTVTGTAPSTGKITAGIVDGLQESFHNI
ncbi:hypothetical protein II906_02185 [bacterium]|nr:hypothetical protein [bacterium]